MKSIVLDLPLPYELSHFDSYCLRFESEILKDNLFGDKLRRDHYILEPKGLGGKSLPVVIHLSGYFGTGHQSFVAKTLTDNYPQSLDKAFHEIIFARHLFIDATTFLGGSQFLNSAQGNYQDYILHEIIPIFEKHFNVVKPKILIGASSGGYGALELISLKDSEFDVALVVSPDSFFEASIIPDFYKQANSLQKLKSLGAILESIKSGDFFKSRNFFEIANLIAMTFCYNDKIHLIPEINYPIDLATGRLKPEVWNNWIKKDPVNFLNLRTPNLDGKKLYLTVGSYDNHHLQMGSRQIDKFLKNVNFQYKYLEFKGDHSSLGPPKIEALKWAKQVVG